MASEEKKKSEEWDIDRKVTFFYRQISPDIENTFTPEQKKEVKKLINQAMAMKEKE